MTSRFISGRRSSAAFQGALLAVVTLAMATTAHAAHYDESVSGDLSSDSKNPTPIGDLALGTNAIVGATVPSGPVVDRTTGELAVQDNDYVSFNVPVGEVLSGLVIGEGSAFEAGDRMFFGIAQGTGVAVDPSFTSAAGLLGWTLVSSAAVGTDVLPALGLSAPANFPPIGGATHFTGPLGAGTYTLWMVDGDRPAVYALDLEVAAVPEPATWLTMLTGCGLVGATIRRRAATRPRAAA